MHDRLRIKKLSKQPWVYLENSSMSKVSTGLTQAKAVIGVYLFKVCFCPT